MYGATAGSILFAHACLYRRIIHRAWCCDAEQYWILSRMIRSQGIANFWDVHRPYGYPLFLAAFPSPVVAFEGQLLLYLAGAWLLARAVGRRSQWGAMAVFTGCCLNVFALAFMPETLTDTLTLPVALFLAVLWVDGLRRRDSWLVTLAGGLLAGFAITLRPSNVFLAPVWFVGRAAVCRRRTLHAAAAAIAVALPLMIQVRANWIHAHRLTAFVVADMYGVMARGGMTLMRAHTQLREPLLVVYRSPWAAPEGVTRWGLWFRQHPINASVTVLLHEFSLLDQDQIFPYALGLRPSYRIPFSVLNHAAVGFGFAGLLAFLRRPEPIVRAARLPLLLYLLGVAGVYANAAIDGRYGLPLLLALFPLAVWRVRYGGRAILWVSVYLVAALLLSGWVRAQAPLIRMAG